MGEAFAKKYIQYPFVATTKKQHNRKKIITIDKLLNMQKHFFAKFKFKKKGAFYSLLT